MTVTGNDSDGEFSMARPGGPWDLLFSYQRVQILYAAAELGIADVLANGPLSYHEIATRVGADPDALRRLLRELIILDLVEQLDTRRFALTKQGAMLRTGAPMDLRGQILLHAGPLRWRAWGELTESIRTGEPPRQEETGMTVFEAISADPTLAAPFHAAMSTSSRYAAPTIAASYDFSKFTTIADLGGGDGTLLAAILAANPNLRGVLVELPETLERAPDRLRASGVEDRCQLIGGDFLESVPGGVDAYLLKNTIHDWNDEFATKILRNCRTATPDAALLLLEFILPSVLTKDDGPLATSSDLNMMIIGGGKERTEEEFRHLLAGAGFTITTTIDLMPPGYHLIEARPTTSIP